MMQVCDFCGTTERLGDKVTTYDEDSGLVRRYSLGLATEDTSSTPVIDQVGFWQLDLCERCLKQFQKTLDNLVQPEIDFNALKKDGVIDASSLKEKLRQRGNSG